MSDHRPRVYHLLGNLIRFHAFPSETSGHCAIIETTTVPGAGAPPNHHAGEDESFYVLEGRYEFMLNGETFEAAPGDFIKIPDGALHAFTCISDTPGRMLQVNAPGMPHEIFFTEAGDVMPDETREVPPPDGPPDMPHLMAVSQKSGVVIVVPEEAAN